MADFQQLRLDERQDVTVVHFRQYRISGVLETEKLEQELYQLVEGEKRTRLVLDFSSVEFLSSQVFGTLVSLNNRLKARGGAMRLCNIEPQVLSALLTCRLDRIFDIKPGLTEALQPA